MTKSKHTARALTVSVLSMILCVAMLIGSTFAWFTDSVTSGQNKIVAGNLDVELYHSNGAATDEKVGADTNLFVNKDGSAVQWEPGVMVYENFTVRNVGSLALKYRLSMNVGDFNTVEEGKSLKDVLKVAILDGAFSGDRTDAEALTFNSTVADFVRSGNLTATGDTSSDTYAVVIYWEPTADDNAYNLSNGKTSSDGNSLFIDLGIDLSATQDTVENDSFGNNYDENADYLIVVNTVDELNNAIGKLQAGDSVAIEMNDNIGLDAKINIPEGVTVALDMKNHKIGHETTEQIGVTPLVNSGNLTVRNAEIYSKDGMLNSTTTPTANAALTSLAGNVVLEKCKLTNFSGRAYGSYCVGISGGTVTLNDCIIDGYRGGISLGGDAVLKASNCTVNAQFYYPVYMYGHSTADFTNCTFNKCKVENPLNPNQAGNAGLIFDNRDNGAPIVKFDTCTFNSTWKDGQSVPLEVSNILTGMIFTDCVFGDNITGLPN